MLLPMAEFIKADMVQRGKWPQYRLLAMMDKVLTRSEERSLFELPDKSSATRMELPDHD